MFVRERNANFQFVNKIVPDVNKCIASSMLASRICCIFGQTSNYEKVYLAARIDDLQIQATDEVREFFIFYQDRILYATDLEIEKNDGPLKFSKRMHERWFSDWSYLSTDSLMTIKGIEKSVQGLNLPQNGLRKIYQKNAQRWYLSK